MAALVSLNIYDDNDEIVKTLERYRIKWGLVKKALSLAEEMSENPEAYVEHAEKLENFVCLVFKGDVTVEELEGADKDDMQVMLAQIIGNSNEAKKNTKGISKSAK